MKSVISAALLAAVSTAAFAHPGHDHSSVTAASSHLFFYGSIAAIVIGGAIVALRKKQSDKK